MQGVQEEAARLTPEMEAQSTGEGNPWSATYAASTISVMKKH